jgi:UMF1 family MFS transporter
MATVETTIRPDQSVAGAQERGASPVAVISWGLYDFANTIYSLNINSIYFPVFIVTLGLADWQYAVPLSISTLIVGLVSPFMGALSDRSAGRRMPWLIVMTLLSVISVAIMGLSANLLVIIVALIVANAAFQISSIFYDALLPSISTTMNWGKISGLGVGMGYVGALLGGQTVEWIIGKGGPPQQAFVPTAFLFILFALPCFFFVRERARSRADLLQAVGHPAQSGLVEGLVPEPPVRAVVPAEPPRVTFISSLTQTWRTLRDARRYPGLWRFLVSHFLYSDALNTVIVAMGVYSIQVIGFKSAFEVLAPAIVASVIGSWLFGFVTDWLTSKQSLIVSLLLWLVVFALAIFISDSSALSQTLFKWLVAPLAGVALGSTWVAARTMMIELSPPEKLGEFMGIYNLTGKFSAVLGPLLWGGTLFLLPPATYGAMGYQVAIAVLGLTVLLGLILHWRGVPNIKRTRTGLQTQA